jgi:hypothetical protein
LKFIFKVQKHFGYGNHFYYKKMKQMIKNDTIFEIVTKDVHLCGIFMIRKNLECYYENFKSKK